MIDLAKENLKKRINLKSSILKMREKELKENGFCKCKSFCRIFHLKHNWQKKPSEVFENKLEAIKFEDQKTFTCTFREDNFAAQNVEKHETSKHGELYTDRDQSG